MMTSSNGLSFRVTGSLCEEFTSHRWIPLTKASDADFWYSLWSVPEKNGWVNSREAGDLRRHCVHYDVIVILIEIFFYNDAMHIYAIFACQLMLILQNASLAHVFTLIKSTYPTPTPESRLHIKTALLDMWIPMINVRQLWDRPILR